MNTSTYTQSLSRFSVNLKSEILHQEDLVHQSPLILFTFMICYLNVVEGFEDL